MSALIRVAIVDDDIFIRESLSMIIQIKEGFELAGTCANGFEAYELVQQQQVDVMLMDMRMPECDGAEGTRLVKEACPATKVIILTTFDDEQYLVQALRHGASGYLLKNSSPDRLLESIRSVMNGNVLMDSNMALKLTTLISQNPTPQEKPACIPWEHLSLTASERGIVEHIANGRTNREIAESLFLSEGTVKNYVTDILSKLALRDRTQLAIWYWKQQNQQQP